MLLGRLDAWEAVVVGADGALLWDESWSSEDFTYVEAVDGRDLT